MRRLLWTIPFAVTACIQAPILTTTVPDDPDAFSCPQELEIFCEASELIRTSYIDDISSEEIALAALEGVEELAPNGDRTTQLVCADDLLKPICAVLDERNTEIDDGLAAAMEGVSENLLDPYSLYLDPLLVEIVNEETSGEFEGIGATVTSTDVTAEDSENSRCTILSETCQMKIVSTFVNGPAQRSGLLAGDRIISVDRKPVEGETLDSVTSWVRGPTGSTVLLGIERDGEILELKIPRQAIQIVVTEWEKVDQVGYVRLNIFSDNSGPQIEAAIEEMTRDGANRIILDLRSNPGGTLTAAIDVVSIFLDSGLVMRGEYPDNEETYRVTGNPSAPDIPLIILIDGASASASEVVAGALQEAGRATVVGETSFGKNTMQSQFGLTNGGAMRLTVARWLTPGGKDLGEGVTPDHVLELDPSLNVRDLVAKVMDAVSLTVEAFSETVSISPMPHYAGL